MGLSPLRNYMTELQATLYELLKALDAVCRRHDIEYFVTGGSALGAVRHNGFIPWDDDMDIGMRRDMWERFREAAHEELPANMVLVDYRSHPKYGNPIARIFNTDTTVLRRYNIADECPKGQYIEVFVHDPVPESKVEEHRRDFITYCELLTPYMPVCHEKYRMRGGLLDEEIEAIRHYQSVKKAAEAAGAAKPSADAAKLLAGAAGSPLSEAIAEYEKKISQYKESESDYMLLEWGVSANYYPLANFSGIRYEKFEDMEIPVPQHACDNLRVDYGNTWTDYPPSMGESPHVSVTDLELPYDRYMELLVREIDLEETWQMRLRQKQNKLQILPLLTEYEKIQAGVRMRHAKITEKHAPDLVRLYEERNYGRITGLFDDYIRLKKKTRNLSVSTDISLETREMIAKALLMQDRVDDAECVCDIPRNMLMRYADAGLRGDIMRLTRAKALLYDGCPGDASAMLDDVSSEMQESLPALKLKARLSLQDGELPQGLEEALSAHPEDQELIKLRGDALLLAGKRDAALDIYDYVEKHSRNGMDLLDIRKKRKKDSSA